MPTGSRNSECGIYNLYPEIANMDDSESMAKL